MGFNDENRYDFLKEENRILQEKEDKYKSFINLSSEGIWRCEPIDHPIDVNLPVEEQIELIFENAIIVECNDTMAKMYGMNKDDILGIPVKEILVKSKRENVEYLRSFIEGGYKLIDAESIEKDSKGNIKYFLNNLVGVVRNGKLISGWGTQRDITNIRKAEEALMKLNMDLSKKNHELLRINNELDNFIYTVTHDLNSPLSNIEGLINVLKLNPSTQEEESKTLIDLMEVALGKFKHTIKNIAEYTKSQRTNDVPHDTSFAEVLADVKFSIGNLISETDAVIRDDFSQVPDTKINRVSLQSVLFNLISNAIKYRHPDRNPEIFVKTSLIDDTLEIEVRDNGIGFSPQKGEEIFELFSRLHYHVEGSGVGLYIVKRIAENSGGSVIVASTPGEGSVFKVYMKVA